MIMAWANRECTRRSRRRLDSINGRAKTKVTRQPTQISGIVGLVRPSCPAGISLLCGSGLQNGDSLCTTCLCATESEAKTQRWTRGCCLSHRSFISRMGACTTARRPAARREPLEAAGRRQGGYMLHKHISYDQMLRSG